MGGRAGGGRERAGGTHACPQQRPQLGTACAGCRSPRRVYAHAHAHQTALLRRPALWTPEDEALAAAAPAAKQPLRPAEWAFFASAALAVAGTCIALGGLAAAQATCNQGGQQRNFMVRRCGGG